MNWHDQLELSLQYEDDIRRRLKHYKPTPRRKRARAALRTRLAHLFRAAARTLEPEAEAPRTPVTE